MFCQAKIIIIFGLPAFPGMAVQYCAFLYNILDQYKDT